MDFDKDIDLTGIDLIWLMHSIAYQSNRVNPITTIKLSNIISLQHHEKDFGTKNDQYCFIVKYTYNLIPKESYASHRDLEASVVFHHNDKMYKKLYNMIISNKRNIKLKEIGI